MWITRPLDSDHDPSSFDSGQSSLDDWLRNEAARAQQQDVARTYVWTRSDDPAIFAYYSITPTQITSDSVTRGIAGGHTIVPGFLLARLALHRDIQGRGYGGQLLRDALETCVNAAHLGAGRVVVVDPIDGAARDFYRRYDFVDTKAADDRMVLKVATARSALGLG